MFYTEAIKFDISVPIYPLLLMLALAMYCVYESFKTRQLAYAFMAGFLVVWTFEIFIARDIWLFGWPITLVNQHLFKNAPFDVLLAAMLYLSARLTITKTNRLLTADILLALPFLVYGLNAVMVIRLPSWELLRFYQGIAPQSMGGFNQAILWLLKLFPWYTVILMLSSFACARLFIRERIWQQRGFSVQLLGLFWFYVSCLGVVQMLVGFNLLPLYWLIEGAEHITWLALISGMVMLFVQGNLRSHESSATTPMKTEKYQSSSLDASTAQQLFETLESVMDTKRLYLNDQLSLRDLADEVGLTTHQLSQTINQMADRNFFDFVNGYRVKAAQQVLSDDQKAHQSVQFIGEAVGFKSKSAFYSAFKKQTGCTPAEYRKRLVKLG